MNKMILIGKLAKDAEIKTSGTGTTFAVLAIPYNYRDRDEQKTDWYKVLVFGKGAEACNGMVKGTQVLVMGTLKLEEYNGKHTLSMITSEVEIISPASGGSSVPPKPIPARPKPTPPPAEADEGDGFNDDIPF